MEGPFNAIVALFAVALVMVSTTRAEPPRLTAAATLPYGELVRAAPVAVVVGALSGLIGSSSRSFRPGSRTKASRARRSQRPCWWRCSVGSRSRFRSALGPLRPAYRAGRARPWLRGRRHRSGPSTALPAGGPAGRSAARRLYVYPLPGLRRPRTQPHADRPGRSGKRPAHSGQWARTLGAVRSASGLRRSGSSPTNEAEFKMACV